MQACGRHARRVAFQPVMDVQILDDRGGGEQEHGVHRGHDCRQRPGDEHASPEGRKQLHDQRGHGQIPCGQIGDDGAAERPGKVHAQEEEPDDERTHDHGVVHGPRIFIAHAFLRGLRQAEDAEAHEYPEGQDHGLRDRVTGAGGRDQAGIDGFEGGDAPFHAAARVDHGDEHHDGGENHDHALDGVREHHGPETAHGGVQDDREPEQRQPDDVGIAGHGLKEPRPSDELGQHGRHEEDQQGQRAEDDHGVAAVAGAQEVGQGHGSGFAGHDGEALAEHAEREEGRGDLDHGQQNPAQAELVGHPGAAHKAARAGVAGDDGHGEHEAAHGAAADEIFLDEPVGVRGLLGLFPGPQRGEEGQGQVDDDRDNGVELGHQNASGWRSSVTSRPSRLGAPPSSSRGMSLKNRRTMNHRSADSSG